MFVRQPNPSHLAHEALTVPLPHAPAATGLSRSYIYRAAAEGKIKLLKAGRTTLVDMASVREHLASLPTLTPKRAAYKRHRPEPGLQEPTSTISRTVLGLSTGKDDTRDISEVGLQVQARRWPSKGNPIVFIPSQIPLMFGPGRTFQPPPPNSPTDTAAALALAVRVDREADQHLAAGHFIQAERLSHLALELRCRAEGRRA